LNCTPKATKRCRYCRLFARQGHYDQRQKAAPQRPNQENADKSVLLWAFPLCGEVYEGKHKELLKNGCLTKCKHVIAKRCHPQKRRNCAAGVLWLADLRYVQYGDYCRKENKAPKERQSTRICLLPLHPQSKTIQCTEPAITEPELEAQLSDILQGYALPKSWAKAN
jgi:hypothetical protein